MGEALITRRGGGGSLGSILDAGSYAISAVDSGIVYIDPTSIVQGHRCFVVQKNESEAIGYLFGFFERSSTDHAAIYKVDWENHTVSLTAGGDDLYGFYFADPNGTPVVYIAPTEYYSNNPANGVYITDEI